MDAFTKPCGLTGQVTALETVSSPGVKGVWVGASFYG